MTGTGFQSTAADVTRAINSFDTSSANARKTMADLESELSSSLGSSSYQGNQAVAFWQLHQKLSEDMQVASKQLDVMRELVHKSHTNYNTGDSSAQDSFSQVSRIAAGNGDVLSRLGLNA